MNDRMSLNLCDPFTLPCGAVIKNRFFKSAMSEALGTADHRPSAGLVRLYQTWAAGGIGVSVTGNVMIDRRALGEPGNVVIEDASDLPLLSEWAAAGGEGGSQLWVQLNHPGRQAPKGLNAETVAPAATPFSAQLKRFFATPRALERAEIVALIERFATAARVVKEAGFGGVQIHGAHGYLVSQFLSPLVNTRTDQWGGSATKRMHFVMELFQAIRAAVGGAFPLGIKLNSADFQRGGFAEEESIEVIRSLAAAGIDAVEISGGTYERPVMSRGPQPAQKESTRQREAYFLEFARRVREASSVPLIVTGGFRSRAGMEAALRSGHLDLIGLARPLAMLPDLPNQLLAGSIEELATPPRTTGIKMIDRSGFLEVFWYARQLQRMARGEAPKLNEGGLSSFFKAVLHNRKGLRQLRRMRA